MKQDILEQLVEDWLQARGYFTRANLKFKPASSHPAYVKKLDNQPSDMDVIGFHPCKFGSDRVLIVNCKSWQDGFAINDMVRGLNGETRAKVGGKDAWKHFRELVVPKWTEAFLAEILRYTGAKEFTHVTAVTFACDPENKRLWEENPKFTKALGNNPVKFISLPELLDEVFTTLGTTVESSQFSRTLQLIKAAGLTVSLKPDRKRPALQ